MPSILTIKQHEAVESCNKMNQAFVDLNTQISVTHNDGYKPLEQETSSEQALQHQMLNASIDMNDLPQDI